MKTITALLMATLIMCPCSSIMAKNPAASVTDKAQKASISTIKDLDNGRLYVMDYTADYKLDKMLQQNINSVDTMLAFVGRELLGATKPAPGAIDAGCSAFAGRTEEGKPIYGRNFDYKMKMTAVMVRTAPKDGYRSIGMADAGWVGYDIGSLSDGKSDLSAAVAMPYLIMDGMNEKGLAVSVLKLDGKPTHQRTGKPQITTTAALRLMLDKAANVDEALALLEKYDMNSSMETANFHFLLSDADGKNAHKLAQNRLFSNNLRMVLNVSRRQHHIRQTGDVGDAANVLQLIVTLEDFCHSNHIYCFILIIKLQHRTKNNTMRLAVKVIC